MLRRTVSYRILTSTDGRYIAEFWWCQFSQSVFGGYGQFWACLSQQSCKWEKCEFVNVINFFFCSSALRSFNYVIAQH